MPPTSTRRHVPDARYRYGVVGRYVRVVGGLTVAATVAAFVIGTRLYEPHVRGYVGAGCEGGCLTDAELVGRTELYFGVNPFDPTVNRIADYFLDIVGSLPVLLALAVFGLLAVVADRRR
ncbi:MAG: hypothetical protein ABEH77_03395 [Halobacteriaceae archaeon]